MGKRPNILLFLTDDHGYWSLPAYGNKEVIAPNFEALAANGTLFENAFTPCPVCSPARACILTGRTPSQVGIHDWIEEKFPEFGERDWLEGEETLPELLQAQGYHCGLSGKWHLGQSHKVPRGFDWCFGLPGGQGGHNGRFTFHLNGEPLTLEGNKAGLITDYALRFLDEVSGEEPFFLNVGYISTHSPYGNQDPELESLYADATFADIPAYVPHPWRRNEDFTQELEFADEEVRRRYRAYYAAVSDIDRNIGRILGRLDESGISDSTVIVYVSDHGLALGHHGFWGKGNSTRPLNMYETSIRVPLIWYAPGTIPVQRVRECVDHYDTFMTLCAIAGVELEDRAYPGTSYEVALRGESREGWEETVYGEYGDLRMIRTPRYKYVRRYPDGPDDLFDLSSYPLERENLAGSPLYGEVVVALRGQLEEWYAKHEDAEKSGLRVKELPRHNSAWEAWRDGIRETRLKRT